jgi:adenylate cyclase
MLYFKNRRITLAQLFGISLIVLIAVLGLLFTVLFKTSQSSVMQASQNLRDAASRELAGRVTAYLNQANQVQESFQTEINHDVFNPKDPVAEESSLFALVLRNSNISEVSFTYGEKIGYDAEGNILLAPSGRGEMSLFRTSNASSAPIDTRSIVQKNGQWVSLLRARSEANRLFGTPFAPEQAGPIRDPTTDLTFVTPANEQYAGRDIWSDLHWSRIDADRNLPESERRVEVSLQRTVADAKGNFLGVLRVGLFEQQINKIGQIKLIPNDPNDPHIIFIADSSGELITRLNAADTLKLMGGNLRYSSESAPPQVRLALRDPALRRITQAEPLQAGQFDYQGETYLVTYREIEGSQDWLLGIVVPQSYYVGPLEAIRDRLLLITSILILCLCVGGFFVQRALKLEQAKILRETVKMHNFEFNPSHPRSVFQDIYEILSSLELAKTAMRAMSKYVPIDLVKQLYQSQKEPVLGGEIKEVSMLFTDIRGFTSIAEKLPVNELATALGEYLQVMTHIIQNNRQGVIDKYIGDAIMALWNATTPLPNYAQLACEAALDCVVALDELFKSSKWRDLPRFETRFGLHQDRVMVGHFGAPDRLNYTAIGNGVNIAARLESLNKQYGTSILVSADIFEAARELFTFRLLDLVAVKGKTEGIKVYELIGRKGDKPAMTEIISKYEQAYEAYRGRHFQEAMNLLGDQLHDGPSKTLHARCLLLMQEPPPASWDGVYISTTK